MTIEGIMNLAPEIKKISSEDVLLFLWTPNAVLPQALRVMGRMGFDYRANLVWVKDRWGMRCLIRQQHEILLVGKKGNPPLPLPEERPSSVIMADTTRHSAQPDMVYKLLERRSPQTSKCELFARKKRPGWVSWGMEVC